MNSYVLDTCILVNFVRNTILFQKLDAKYNFLSPKTMCFISIVSKAEILSIALSRSWKGQKLKKLDTILKNIDAIPIDGEDIVDAYTDIDVYSLGKHPKILPPSGFSAKKMGKNDIWIAATASVVGATLITTDKDFSHLQGSVFVDVVVE